MVEPEVGMGATISYGTDMRPYTIVELVKGVRSGKKQVTKIVLRGDIAVPEKSQGFHETRKYHYLPDVAGHLAEATLRKDGSWKMIGSTTPVSLGRRRYYYDESF